MKCDSCKKKKRIVPKLNALTREQLNNCIEILNDSTRRTQDDLNYLLIMHNFAFPQHQIEYVNCNECMRNVERRLRKLYNAK